MSDKKEIFKMKSCNNKKNALVSILIFGIIFFHFPTDIYSSSSQNVATTIKIENSSGPGTGGSGTFKLTIVPLKVGFGTYTTGETALSSKLIEVYIDVQELSGGQSWYLTLTGITFTDPNTGRQIVNGSNKGVPAFGVKLPRFDWPDPIPPNWEPPFTMLYGSSNYLVSDGFTPLTMPANNATIYSSRPNEVVAGGLLHLVVFPDIESDSALLKARPGDYRSTITITLTK